MRFSTTTVGRGSAAAALITALSIASCTRGQNQSPQTAAAAPGPRAVDVVRVVEQPLDVQLSLPGELTGTSAGIGRCQLHLVGVGIGFSNNGVEVRSPPTVY